MADAHIHTICVRHHRITCDSPVLVQHGMGHDAVALDLDAEWDGLAVRIVLGPCGSAYDVLYEGQPVTVPASTLAEAGWLPVPVVGYGDDGAVRVTTERCDHLLRVVESGCVDGSVPPEDQPDLLGQLVEAAERAHASADDADKAAASAMSAASAATEAAGTVDAAVESATKAAQSATDAATAATDAAKSATDAAERADMLAEDIPAYVTAAQQAATEAARAASDAGGSAAAAGKSASAAAGSAERAAVSATAASESAEAAQGHATDAAQSAAEAESWADAARVSAGNVLTGTASGPVAHADDAYAAKPREVRIEGRTVKNLWPVINGTSNGVTVSTDETGLITVSGTATADASITAESAYAPSSAYVMASTYGSPSTWHIVNGETQVTSGTQLAAPSATCGVAVKSGITVDASFRVMLVEGSEAPDCFVPTGLHSVGPKNLGTAGKNLLRLRPNIEQSTVNGVTFTQQDDGGILVNGTNDGFAVSYFNLDFSGSKPAESSLNIGALVGSDIVASGNSTTVGINAGFFSQDGHMNYFPASSNGLAATVPPGAIAFRTFLSVRLGKVVNNETVYPQIELGSTATAYEPPNITQTPLPEVELRSLPNGTCDELVIRADGTCRVERRTQLSGDEVTALPEPTTEPQAPVTLPQLPAPTFNIWHDSQVPSDTSVEYERDVNIAYAELEAKIAALSVAQATS